MAVEIGFKATVDLVPESSLVNRSKWSKKVEIFYEKNLLRNRKDHIGVLILDFYQYVGLRKLSYSIIIHDSLAGKCFIIRKISLCSFTWTLLS